MDYRSIIKLLPNETIEERNQRLIKYQIDSFEAELAKRPHISDKSIRRVNHVVIPPRKPDGIPVVQSNIYYEPTKNFVKVNTDIIEDPSISLQAQGLYVALLKRTAIPNFILYKGSARNCCRNGCKSFDSAWDELKEVGLLKLNRIRGFDNKYYYRYELLEDFDKTTPVVNNIRLQKIILDANEKSIIKEYAVDTSELEDYDFSFECINEDDITLDQLYEYSDAAKNEENSNCLDSNTLNRSDSEAVISDSSTYHSNETSSPKDMKVVTELNTSSEIINRDSISDTSKSEIINKSFVNSNSKNSKLKTKDPYKVIKDKIEYDYLIEKGDKELIPYIESIFSVMCYIMRYNSPTITIGNQTIPIDEVRAKFAQIDSGHIIYVCERIRKSKTKITNIRSYLIIALMQSVDTIDMYYEQEVRDDGLI